MTDATACTYAAFIAEGKRDAATISAVLKAAGVTVNDAFVKNYSAYVAKADFNKILKNVSFGGGAAAPAAAPAAAAAAAPAKAAAAPAKPKVEEEEDGEMGFGLFD